MFSACGAISETDRLPAPLEVGSPEWQADLLEHWLGAVEAEIQKASLTTESLEYLLGSPQLLPEVPFTLPLNECHPGSASINYVAELRWRLRQLNTRLEEIVEKLG